MQFITLSRLAKIRSSWLDPSHHINHRNLSLRKKRNPFQYFMLLLLFLTIMSFSGCKNTLQPTVTSSPQSTSVLTPTVDKSSSPTGIQDATKTATSSEPVEKMAMNYCQILKDHNYTEAYTYLDANATDITTAQKLTLHLFTQLAQDDENSQGSISSYNAAAYPPLVVLTISRNSGPYHVHLQVKLENSVWKIISLDRI